MLKRTFLITCCCVAVSLLGCAEEKKDGSYNKTPEGDKKPAHSHGSHGPNKGDLIELGSPKYHGELTHDDKSVTIYILNGAADKQLPIKAEKVVIQIVHGEETESFDLPAKPMDGEKDGMSSRFTAEDDHLLADVEEEGAKKTLVVEIDGKSYRGKIEHHHDDDDDDDHKDHDHKDDDHKDDDDDKK